MSNSYLNRESTNSRAWKSELAFSGIKCFLHHRVRPQWQEYVSSESVCSCIPGENNMWSYQYIRFHELQIIYVKKINLVYTK